MLRTPPSNNSSESESGSAAEQGEYIRSGSAAEQVAKKLDVDLSTDPVKSLQDSITKDATGLDSGITTTEQDATHVATKLEADGEDADDVWPVEKVVKARGKYVHVAAHTPVRPCILQPTHAR